MSDFFLGLDLGQANDYTALGAIERIGGEEGPATWHLRHLERMRGVPYPQVVARVAAVMVAEPLRAHCRLVVDATGVGQPVVDLLAAAGLWPIAVFIHGGQQATLDKGAWHVPKRDLVAVVQVLLQSARLRIAASLPLAGVLEQELLNFRVTIDFKTAHDSYAAWCEGQHDDLVLAVALACWYGERGLVTVRAW